MVEHDDEDALGWAGEDRLNPSPQRPRAGRKAAHTHEVESTLEADAILDFDEDENDAAPSSSALVTFGVLGGIYFLYTLGWLTFALRSAGSTDNQLAGAMFTLGLWLAVAAPALWFVLSFWLIERLSIRYGVLVLGAVLLIPIPLVWPS